MPPGSVTIEIPTLGEKFKDYRMDIAGDSFNWGPVLQADQVQHLTFHHSVTPQTAKNDGNWKAECDRIAAIHMNSNGWAGIGYHFIICSDGTVAYVQDLSHGGSNIKDHNDINIGVCFIGDFRPDKDVHPTSEQIHSAHKLAEFFLSNMPAFPNLDSWDAIRGHKDWADPKTGANQTTCPGTIWPDDLKHRIKFNVGYKAQEVKSVELPTYLDTKDEWIADDLKAIGLSTDLWDGQVIEWKDIPYTVKDTGRGTKRFERIPEEVPDHYTTPPSSHDGRGVGGVVPTSSEPPKDQGSVTPQTPQLPEKPISRGDFFETFRYFLNATVEPAQIPFVIAGFSVSLVALSLILLGFNSPYLQYVLPFTNDVITKLDNNWIGITLPWVIGWATRREKNDTVKAFTAIAVCALFGLVASVPKMTSIEHGVVAFTFKSSIFYMECQAVFWAVWKRFPFLYNRFREPPAEETQPKEV